MSGEGSDNTAEAEWPSPLDRTLLGRLIIALAKLAAIAGGLVLCVLVLIVVVSIFGRAFIWAGLKPIRGDYELVEAGVLFAIFAFMPWAHLTRGHAIVGVLTDRFPIRVNVFIELLMDILMLVIACFLTWRHWAGMLDKMSYGETTLLLGMPIWWSYAASMVGALIFVLVAIYCIVRSTIELFSANPRMPMAGMSE